jgi:hypothetical protein
MILTQPKVSSLGVSYTMTQKEQTYTRYLDTGNDRKRQEESEA